MPAPPRLPEDDVPLEDRQPADLGRAERLHLVALADLREMMAMRAVPFRQRPSSTIQHGHE
jgi:hypothetical protein